MPRHWSLCFSVPRVLRISESVFYFRAIFTINSFLLVLRPPRGRQLNLKVSRTSYWSLKHSPGLAICLNHNNPQERYSGRFYLRAMAGWFALWRICLKNSFRDKWKFQKPNALSVRPQCHMVCHKLKLQCLCFKSF